jgi:hypothetical protein
MFGHLPNPLLRDFSPTRTKLVRAMEAEAVGRGCHSAFLDTFSYQARPFYEKLGYEVFGALDDYPRGLQRFYMRKRLSEA